MPYPCRTLYSNIQAKNVTKAGEEGRGQDVREQGRGAGLGEIVQGEAAGQGAMVQDVEAGLGDMVLDEGAGLIVREEDEGGAVLLDGQQQKQSLGLPQWFLAPEIWSCWSDRVWYPCRKTSVS